MSFHEFVTCCAFGVALCAAFFVGHERRRIDKLQHRVDCLEHPHQESSTAVKLIRGRYVVTQKPHLTGCPTP